MKEKTRPRSTVKWRPNNKASFQEWEECARCGLPWPKRVIIVQRGIRVCPECDDEKDHQQRIADGEMKEPRDTYSPWDPD